MSYQCKYTSEEDVEIITQFDITSTTRPNSTQVNSLIQSVEREIDGLKLGWKDGGAYGDGYSISNLYIDVSERNFNEDGTVEVYLPEYPVLSVISLERRTTPLNETPQWEPLTRGYYTGWTEGQSDYKLIMSYGKDGQQYGIGFYFYSNKKPLIGKASLKASLVYSYNVPSTVLKEYASLKVAIEVLKTAIASGEPVRIGGFTGGDWGEFLNTNLRVQIDDWLNRIEQIKKDHFPDTLHGFITI